MFVARDRGHERAREPEKRRGRARGGEDVLVGRSKDVNAFVKRRKTVFVSRTKDMSVLVDRSHVPGGTCTF